MGFPWGAILSQILAVFLQVLFYQPFFWIIVVLIWLQNRRLLNTREALFGVRGSVLYPVLTAIGYGILGGLIGSVLMVVLGISLNDLGILWLWIIAILLMLINPRFLCFSYAGGILALISLLTGYPKLNIPALMGLVAVLHLIESVLILISGHIDPLPVYVRNRFGRVVGAFNLQKFWPIPLVVVAMATVAQQGPTGDMIRMPDWWPLLRPLGVLSAQAAYGLLPVIAALGYGELAVTCLPRERVRRTSLHLTLFSLVLLCLAILAAYVPQTVILVTLFAPLGHEVVIRVEQRSELQGQPRFVPPARGVMVLDALRGSPSQQAGLRSGDVILKIADIPVNSRAQLAYALDISGPSVEIEYQQEPGRLRRTRITVDPNGPPDLIARYGVILAPEPNDPPTVDLSTTSPLQGIYRRLARARH
ncbi:MAG: PDZ domain-containing protein [Thermacetogeniaceae bacterium]